MQKTDLMKTIHSDKCPVCGHEDMKPYLECKDNFATQEIFSLVQCRECGFVLTQDFPSENEIGRYYDVPEYISHTDTQKGIINTLYHWARKIALKSKSKIVQKYATKQNGMLLDIGCGTGYFLNRMKQLKWIVTGIEKAESPRNYAKEKFGLNCQASDYLFDIPAQTKDVITMWHVLEHLEQLNKTMAILHKILRNDGVAIIALPNRKSYDAEHYKSDWAAYDVPRHLWHFSPDDFELLANKHSFELVDVKPMYFDAFYISMMSEKNKGMFAATLVGLIRGFFYFVGTLFDKKRSSSLIYILKKK